MKHLLIIFSLLLTSVSWSEDVDSNDLVEREGLLYEKFTNEPFTGKTTGRMQGKIIGGKLEGDYVMYRKNGTLLGKGKIIDGKREGEYLQYSESGQLQYKRKYKDDKTDC